MSKKSKPAASRGESTNFVDERGLKVIRGMIRVLERQRERAEGVRLAAYKRGDNDTAIRYAGYAQAVQEFIRIYTRQGLDVFADVAAVRRSPDDVIDGCEPQGADKARENRQATVTAVFHRVEESEHSPEHFTLTLDVVASDLKKILAAASTTAVRTLTFEFPP